MSSLARRVERVEQTMPKRIDIEPRLRAMAAQCGLDPDEVIAEAKRILVQDYGYTLAEVEGEA